MRKIFEHIDWILVGAMLMLIGFGLVLIYSATYNYAQTGQSWHMQRQIVFLIIGLVLAVVSLAFDYRGARQYTIYLYGFNIFMLLIVMFFGHSQLGAQRWLQIGSFSFQPSEFSKLFMIICLASFMERRIEWLDDFSDYFKIFGFLFIPFILVLKQPDLGTSLSFIAILIGMAFVSGFQYKWIFRITAGLVFAAPLLWEFVLQDYQKARIKVFLNPELDPFGSGYHVIQSKIAIGSGGFFGKGWLEGTQSQLNFLPENHTDFIFAVAGEEFGFFGVCLIFLLYFVIILRGIKIALNAEDDFGMLLAIGVTSMFIFHIFVNIGMTMGIMPVTGVPLPFLSYGVSSLLTNIMSVALLLNISTKNAGWNFK